jgi:hypothetical protein
MDHHRAGTGFTSQGHAAAQILVEIERMVPEGDQILAPELRGNRHPCGEPEPVPTAEFQELELARVLHLPDRLGGRMDPQGVRMQGGGHATQRAERGAACELFDERLEAGLELGHAQVLGRVECSIAL